MPPGKAQAGRPRGKTVSRDSSKPGAAVKGSQYISKICDTTDRRPAKATLNTRAGLEQRLTDVIMFNSRNLGALIVAEEPHVKSWEDGQYNIQNMSIEETYGFGILQEGQAVAVAKNVKIRPNEFVCPISYGVLPVYTRSLRPSGLFATFAFHCRITANKRHRR